MLLLKGMAAPFWQFGDHPSGEPATVEDSGEMRCLAVETFGGLNHVEWDPQAAVTNKGGPWCESSAHRDLRRGAVPPPNHKCQEVKRLFRGHADKSERGCLSASNRRGTVTFEQGLIDVSPPN